jgi:hypothetical protein
MASHSRAYSWLHSAILPLQCNDTMGGWTPDISEAFFKSSNFKLFMDASCWVTWGVDISCRPQEPLHLPPSFDYSARHLKTAVSHGRSILGAVCSTSCEHHCTVPTSNARLWPSYNPYDTSTIPGEPEYASTVSWQHGSVHLLAFAPHELHCGSILTAGIIVSIVFEMVLLYQVHDCRSRDPRQGSTCLHYNSDKSPVVRVRSLHWQSSGRIRLWQH